LPPSSAWTLDYAAENCRMSRQFGTGNSEVLLVLDQFEPGDSLKVTLAGWTVKPASTVRPILGKLQFGPGNAESEIEGVRGLAGSKPVFLLKEAQRIAPFSKAEEDAIKAAASAGTYYKPPPVGAAGERAASWLAVKDIMKFDLVLETGPMDAPMKALRDCVWDLVGSWGLDVAEQKGLTREARPRPSGQSWFQSKDYPLDMIRSEQEGIVNIRLIVDRQGIPESCHVQVSTRPKEFDDVVCGIMMRKARFDPALDAKGQPVRSYYQSTVVFELR